MAKGAETLEYTMKCHGFIRLVPVNLELANLLVSSTADFEIKSAHNYHSMVKSVAISSNSVSESDKPRILSDFHSYRRFSWTKAYFTNARNLSIFQDNHKTTKWMKQR